MLQCVASRIHPGLLWVAVSIGLMAIERPPARGQEAGVAAETWPVRFADDMQEDRRDAYGRSGEVTWEPGRLTLRPGSVLWPEVAPGPRLEFRAQLQFDGLDPPGTGLRAEFCIPFRKSEAIVARFDQERPVVGPGQITLLIADQAEGGARETVLGRFPVEGGLKSGEWTFIYRYGLLTVASEGKVLASGYTPYVRSVAGIMCFPKVGSVQIRKVNLRAVARPPSDYTEAQQKAFEAAAGAFARANRAFEGDDMALVAREAERAYEGFGSVVGERHPYTIMAMARLGHAWSQAPGRSAEARALLDRTLLLAGEVYGESHPEVADVWSRIAGARLVSNDSLGALRAYVIAERMLAETQGPISLARGVILVQAGYAALQGGRTPEARGHFEEALAVLGAAVGPDSPAAADAHRELGSLLSRERRFDEAARHLDLALKIYTAASPEGRDTFDARFRLAEMELARGREDEAEEHLRRALAIAEVGLGPVSDATAGVLGMLGTVAVERGRPEEALPLLKRMVEVVEKLHGPDDVHTAIARGWLAALHHVRGDFAAAEPLLAQSFEIEFKAASAILPGLSESEALEYVQGVYKSRDMMIGNSRRMSGVREAGVYRPVWQSRSMVTRLVGRQRPELVADPEQRRDLESLEEVRHRLGSLTLTAGRLAGVDGEVKRQLDRLSEQKEGLERRLQGRVPWLARQRQAPSVDFVEVVGKLSPRTAVVDIVRSTVPDNGVIHYDAFVLRSVGEDRTCRVRWVPLGPAAPVDRAARAWRSRIAAGRGLEPADEPRTPADAEAPESIIRRLIWEKLEPSLADVGHIILIPDGATTRIPWGAIPGRLPGRVLLEDYSFSTVGYGQQLAQILASEPRPRADEDRAVLAGAIAYGPSGGRARKGWPDLPATRDEVDGIARLWGDARTLDVLSGREATEDALRKLMPGARIIHLATHGFFDDRSRPTEVEDGPATKLPASWNLNLGSGAVRGEVRDPSTLSGVILAGANLRAGAGADPGPAADGILTAEEVIGLDLSRTDLVLLSACETGLGDTAGGEGVFGLQRAFELAGASTCISSRWQIPDRATMVLIARFYDNLWKKGMGKLAALREAQLWMMREGAGRPDLVRGEKTLPGDRVEAESGRLPAYYWAGFVLSGDWR